MATVLLVEDDPGAREGLELALRRLGYGVHPAASGEVKPVEPRVLDARIRAVLRRITRAGSPAETHGELVIDRDALIVRRGGRELSLTPTELRLLLVLSGSAAGVGLCRRGRDVLCARA